MKILRFIQASAIWLYSYTYALLHSKFTRRRIDIVALMSIEAGPMYEASYRVSVRSPIIHTKYRALRLIPEETELLVASAAMQIAIDLAENYRLPPTAVFIKVGKKKSAEILREVSDE